MLSIDARECLALFLNCGEVRSRTSFTADGIPFVHVEWKSNTVLELMAEIADRGLDHAVPEVLLLLAPNGLGGTGLDLPEFTGAIPVPEAKLSIAPKTTDIDIDDSVVRVFNQLSVDQSTAELEEMLRTNTRPVFDKALQFAGRSIDEAIVIASVLGKSIEISSELLEPVYSSIDDEQVLCEFMYILYSSSGDLNVIKELIIPCISRRRVGGARCILKVLPDAAAYATSVFEAILSVLECELSPDDREEFLLALVTTRSTYSEYPSTSSREMNSLLSEELSSTTESIDLLFIGRLSDSLAEQVCQFPTVTSISMREVLISLQRGLARATTLEYHRIVDCILPCLIRALLSRIHLSIEDEGISPVLHYSTTQSNDVDEELAIALTTIFFTSTVLSWIITATNSDFEREWTSHTHRLWCHTVRDIVTKSTNPTVKTFAFANVSELAPMVTDRFPGGMVFATQFLLDELEG